MGERECGRERVRERDREIERERQRKRERQRESDRAWYGVVKSTGWSKKSRFRWISFT